MGKIKIKAENKGKFTAWAKSHGMTVQQAAVMILRNRERYSPTLIKRANFARNAAKWEDGGVFMPNIPEYKSGGIHINPKNKGKFNATKKATGKSTEELTHSKNPKTRKRAIFAQNAKKWKHGDGGLIDYTGMGIAAMQNLNDPKFRKEYFAQTEQYNGPKYITGTVPTPTGSLANFKLLGKVGKFAKAIPWQESAVRNLGGLNRKLNDSDPTGGGFIGVSYNEISKQLKALGDIRENKYGLGGLSTMGIQSAATMGASNAISMAGSGLGAIPTPWTQIAGMGLNLIGGVVDKFKQARELKEQQHDQGVAAAQAGQAGIINPYAPTFKIGGTFKGKKFGGKPNAEVEGGEVLITPDGSQTNVNGPSHSSGGVDVNLPNNTMILSDKVKVGKGQTAADAVRPYTSKINKAQAVIKGNATKLAKQSAQLNLNKYYSKVLDTYNKQEAKKFAKGGKFNTDSLPTFADGDIYRSIYGDDYVPGLVYSTKTKDIKFPQIGATDLTSLLGGYGGYGYNSAGNAINLPEVASYDQGNPEQWAGRHKELYKAFNDFWGDTPVPGTTSGSAAGNYPGITIGNNKFPLFRQTPGTGVPNASASSGVNHRMPYGEESVNPYGAITNPVKLPQVNVSAGKTGKGSGSAQPYYPGPKIEGYTAPQDLMDVNLDFPSLKGNSWEKSIDYQTKAENLRNNPKLGGYNNYGEDRPKFDWGDAASTFGEMAPMLYNLGQGLFGKREQMRASDYANPYEGQINSLMANRRYNIDPELAANETAFRTTAANMRNLGGSRGQVMSNLTGAQNTKQFGDMSAWANKHNMENQYAAEYAQTLYPMGRDRSMTRMMVDESNAMSRASGRNMTGAAMTGLQQYLLTRRQMKNQSVRDKLLNGVLKGYSPYAAKLLGIE